MDAQTQNGTSARKNVFLIINQQITPLTKDVIRLGRQLDNDVVFNEEAVSRSHAEIRCENGKYILHDLLSTSGTFVNSRRIERCVLNSGDLISLANVQFMFVNNNPRIANNSANATRNLTLPSEADRPAANGK
jgi:pSer/pThr/pTyr-binding forkhead associated (FHA) protein